MGRKATSHTGTQPVHENDSIHDEDLYDEDISDQLLEGESVDHNINLSVLSFIYKNLNIC